MRGKLLVMCLSVAAVAASATSGRADHWRSGYRSTGLYPGGYWHGQYENGTAWYHYTHPRVTTGYGFRSVYPRYRSNIYRSGFGRYGGYGTRSFGRPFGFGY